MSHLHTEHEEPKNNVHVFYIGFGLENDARERQKKARFYNELFDDIPPFAFGPRKVIEKYNENGIWPTAREAAQMIYGIPEIQEAAKEYLDSDNTEDKYIKRGEFGELILYHFLHEYFNAEALISKIYFKDSRGQAAHGFDAVHVDEENEILWLGESKLYKDGKRAIEELSKDLSSHFNNEFFDNEFSIITNRARDDGAELNELMKKLINPQVDPIHKLARINIALFAGFDSECFKDYQSEKFREILDQEVDKLRQSANDKTKTHGWYKKLNLYLFLFPLDDKKQFVSDLHQKLKAAQQI